MAEVGPTDSGHAGPRRHDAGGRTARTTGGPSKWLGVVALLMFGSVLATPGHADEALRLGFPAYAYPTLGPMWDELAWVGPGSIVIVNPASGPGAAADPIYRSALEPVRAGGVDLFGYVDTAYGNRAVDVMLAEADAYARWYRPVGIFLDQTPPGPEHLPLFRELVPALRARGFQVAINPGQPDIEPEYAALADYVLNFEGTYESYRNLRVPSWAYGFPRERFWHLVHTAPGVEALVDVVRAAPKQHAGILYVTDALMPNPWDRLASYWSPELALLGLEPLRAA